MNDRSLTPRVRAALRRLAAGPQDMRDEALLQEINEEMKKLDVEDVACVRDRVRYTCPPCPMVQSVVLMLDGADRGEEPPVVSVGKMRAYGAVAVPS